MSVVSVSSDSLFEKRSLKYSYHCDGFILLLIVVPELCLISLFRRILQNVCGLFLAATSEDRCCS